MKGDDPARSRADTRGFGNSLLDWRVALVSVALPVALRAIPEFIAGGYPLGFDTVWVYAPFVKAAESGGFESAMRDIADSRGAPLMYFILTVVGIVSMAEPFVVTKTVGPLLHGFLVFSFYYFAKCGLRWDDKRALALIFLAAMTAVPLRFSWDMYKNALGAGFLFMSLAHLHGRPRRMDEPLFVAMAGLSVLSSELTAVVLAGVAGWFFGRQVVKHGRRPLGSPLVAVGSAVAVLVYVGILFAPSAGYSPLGTPPPPLSLPQDYLGPGSAQFSGLDHLYLTVSLLTGITLLPVVPLVIFGLFREPRSRLLTVGLVPGAFSLLVVPFGAIPLWHRWLFMLALVLLVFAARGILRLPPRVRNAYAVGLISLSIPFVIAPAGSAFPYYAAPQTLPYFPSSLLQNSVPLEDSGDVVAATRWLNQIQSQDAILVVSVRFFGWAKLYSTMPQIYAFVEPGQVDSARFPSASRVFMVYFAPDHDWYEASMMPQSMMLIHEEGSIGAYELVRM